MLPKNRIKYINSLGSKKNRVKENTFIAEGVKIIRDLLSSSLEVIKIYTTEEKDIQIFDLDNIDFIEKIPKEDMKKISQLKTPNTSLALVTMPNKSLLDIEYENIILALDGVQDPGNLGTIIRLADWFGVKDIVCSIDTADAFNPKVIQATMGAISRVNLHYTPLDSFLDDALQNQQLPIYGTFLEGSILYETSLDKNKGIIIMGNEGKGISSPIKKRVSQKLFIPSYPENIPTSESLNVSMATGIILSEFRRK